MNMSKRPVEYGMLPETLSGEQVYLKHPAKIPYNILPPVW
jgi:hypothetical protein